MSKHIYYTLEGHRAKPCDDVLTWGRWMRKNRTQNIIVGETHIGADIFISTVFLGIDQLLGDYSKPALFETMIFRKNQIPEKRQVYATWKDAERGHQYHCENHDI